MTTLSCSNVTFAYTRGAPVLRAVSAEFPVGQVTAVLGPNGSGKSTLLRILLGALSPSEGRAELGGRDVRTLRGVDAARRLAYVSQRTEAGTPLTVGQVVALGRYAVGTNAAAVHGALELLELTDLRDRPVGELSAGQQQRVALGRVAAQLWPLDTVADDTGTRVVLADEPVSNLDPLHSTRALRTLRAWSRTTNLAVVVVLHDLTSALRYADRALLLSAGGRVAAAGPIDEVLRDDVLRPVFDVGFERLELGAARAVVPVE